MKILYSILVAFAILSCGETSKLKEKISEPKVQKSEIDDLSSNSENEVSTDTVLWMNKVLKNIDSPIDFGYKTSWIAVSTNQKDELANMVGLKNIATCNWESGLDPANIDKVFITPQIGKWTLVVGLELESEGTEASFRELISLLHQLSAKYGEAHYFGTHRVVEYHSWIKSENGELRRAYAYLGDHGENIIISGQPTKPEIGLELVNTFSAEADADDYWGNENLTYPNEELVMKIAEAWSINPTKLSTRKDIAKELGLIGIDSK